MSYDVFISYQSRDVRLAEGLNARLLREGWSVWFDRVRLQPGYNWHREIEAATEASRIVVPVVTANWKTSDWCRFETYGAERIVPLLFRGEWAQVAPAPLQHFQYFDLRDQDRADWSRIFSAIRAYLAERAPEKLPRVAALAYAHNPYFVGREKLLLEIHEQLHPAPMTTLAQASAHVITGVGGVGKTTLAREYADKFWRLYHDLLWVRADCALLSTEFARLAVELGLIRNPSQDANEDAKAALRELNGRTPRLLILDNAIDEQSIQPWLPTTGGCSILITSRFARWSPVMRAVGVDVLTPEAARMLLMSRGISGAGSNIRGADRLAAELGYLPLALEQAAALMLKIRVGFDDYLELYAKRRRQLLAARFLGATNYPDSVATTWQTTVAHVGKHARPILGLLAHFAADDIPVSLLEQTEWMPQSFLSWSTWKRRILRILFDKSTEAAPPPFLLREALAELADFSMIEFRADAVSVHRLVQAVQMDRQRNRSRKTWARRAVLGLYRAFPAADYENLLQCARLLPHARVAAAAASRWKFRFNQAALLFNQVAIYLQRRGQYPEAEPFFVQALDIWRKSWLGKFNPNFATGLSNLGILYNEKGEYSKAEPILLNALALKPRFLRQQDPTVANILSGLATIYSNRGDYAAAEAKYQEAREIRRTTVGERGYLYAESLNNLASLYVATNKYFEAEQLYQEALQITRLKMSDNHPVVTQIKQNLAVVYYKLKKYAEAEHLYCSALVTREAALGTDHPDLAYILTNMGKLYRDQGRHADAEQVLLRATKLRCAVFGDHYPELARTLSILGTVYEASGKQQEAEAIHSRALEIVSATIGEKDPLAVVVKQNYMAYHRAANCTVEAEQFEAPN